MTPENALSPEQHRRVEAIFAEASELPTGDRTAFLERACGSDASVRGEVESLLSGLGADTFEPLRTSRMGLGSAYFEQPGDQIGHYRLVRRLGEGGFGAVWLAAQSEPVQRQAALKIIKPGMDSRQILARFERERQSLELLDHPYVATILDAGVTDRGRPFFVMEYVDGRPITQSCNDARLTIAERLGLFLKVCSAIEHAHQKGIIHRDIKPSNILARMQDGALQPRVIDFGIARFLDRAGHDLELTQASQLIGTPAYTSPEQALGSRAIDTRSDVYSLGVVLYELLTDELPLSWNDVTPRSLDQFRRQIVDSAAKAPSSRVTKGGAAAADRRVDPATLRRLLLGDLDWITLKALEKDPARRYQHVAELASDITRHIEDKPISAGQPSAMYRARKFVKRNQGLVAAAAALSLTVCAAAAGVGVSLARALRAENDAVIAQQRATREAAIATAVNEFLNEDLLSAADPGRTEDREVTVREALDIAAQKVGERFVDRPLVEAQIRSTLARTYTRLGDAASAEPHHRRAVELYTAHLGPEAKPTMDARNSLATNLMQLGRFAEAAERLEEDRRVVLATRDPEDGLAVRSTSNLAAAYLQLGRLREAAPLLEDSLAAKRRTLGDDDPSTLTSVHNLAGLYVTLDRVAEAVPLYREAYERRREVLGPGDPSTLNSMAALGRVLTRTGAGEGRRLSEDAIAIARERLSPGHPTLLRCLDSLVQDYMSSDQHEQAVRLLRELVALRREYLGPAHIETVNATASLATALLETGANAEAGSLCRSILELDAAALPDDHWLRGDVSITYGQALERLGEFAQAETALLDGRRRLVAALGARHELSLASTERLIEFYEQWASAEPGKGRAGAAADWRTRLEDTKRGSTTDESAQPGR